MSIQHLDFYFDYISPYAYFAWFNVKALCDRRGLDLYAHPVLFAGLLNHWGQLGPAEIPPKREFVFKDAARYAARRGIGQHSHADIDGPDPRVHLFLVI